MNPSVKARYSEGTLVLLEPVDLEEGVEVTVSIEETVTNEVDLEAWRATIGAWKGAHDPEELLRSIYADRLANTALRDSAMQGPDDRH